jgi:serine protease Do
MPRPRFVVVPLLAAAAALHAVPAFPLAQAKAAAVVPRSDLAALDAQLDALARQVAPSVVQVIASGYATAPGALLARAGASGSGVIVDGEGWSVTNAHVVEGALGVRVDLQQPRAAGTSILRPRSRRVAARVVGVDRETDVAVLKVEQAGLAALAFGDSDALHQGEVVLAFGSPLGLENSVSLGVVSAVARQLRPDEPMIYVQTDASINPGNSGGPLVDVAGRMVGLNTMILSQSGGNEGIGLAAPGNIVRSVYEQIRKGGRVRRGYLGVRAQTITPPLATGLGLASDRGVVLSDVLPSGPGALAGLRAGDVVVALDGKPMENGRQLDVNVYRRAPGETVTLSVSRGRQSLEVPVQVVERPEDPDRFLSLVTPEKNLVPRLGVLALELDDDVRKALDPVGCGLLRATEGVVVAARSGGSPGSDDDLRAGDVIHAVNGVSVRGLSELRSAVARAGSGEPLVLHVERSGKLLYAVVETE